MKKIYCISGLGADHRVFGNMSIPGAELVPVPWPVYDKEDTIVSYATKIIAQIKDKDPYILGVSLGGILGLEIAKQIPVSRVWMISSAKKQKELFDGEGFFIGWIMKHGLVPDFIMRHPFSLVYRRFGATSPEDKKLFSAIMKDTDFGFVRWAFGALGQWDNETIPPQVVHIHGTDDHIIPSRLVQPDHWIEGGTHFMIFNRAGEVSSLVQQHM